jgi:hypothetical protein
MLLTVKMDVHHLRGVPSLTPLAGLAAVAAQLARNYSHADAACLQTKSIFQYI